MHPGTLLFETLVLRPRVPGPRLVEAWRDVRSRGLAALVHFEGGATWVWRRLRETRAAEVAPAPFAQAVAGAARADAARNLLVDEEVERTVRHLESLGVPSVLIKGIARRVAAPRWPYADARATRDVDVIVPAALAERAWNGLVALGYHRYSEATSPHELPGLAGEGQVSVDIHTSLGHTLPSGEAWRRATAGAVTLVWRGLEVRVPCATELLWHGLIHALQHGVAAWRLGFLLDGAAILAGNDAIAWDTLRARLEASEAPGLGAIHWLDAAAQLAGVGLPDLPGSGGKLFDVARALRWRCAVLGRGRDAGFTARLLEEGTRTELRLSVAPVVEGTGPLTQTRRWVAGRAARLAYGAWRVVDRNGADGRLEWNNS